MDSAWEDVLLWKALGCVPCLAPEKEGLWVMSPMALSPALAPAPSQKPDPAAWLQKQSRSRAGGICVIRSDATSGGIARDTATCTPLLAATVALELASAGLEGALEPGEAPVELGLHLAPPSAPSPKLHPAPELASPLLVACFVFHFSLLYFFNF